MLATEEGYEGRGYRTAALKVALLNMKEHYLSPKVRVEALTARDSHHLTGVEFWETFGLQPLGSVSKVCWESRVN